MMKDMNGVEVTVGSRVAWCAALRGRFNMRVGVVLAVDTSPGRPEEFAICRPNGEIIPGGRNIVERPGDELAVLA